MRRRLGLPNGRANDRRRGRVDGRRFAILGCHGKLREDVVLGLNPREPILVDGAVLDLARQFPKAQQMVFGAPSRVLHHGAVVDHECPVAGLGEQQFTRRLVDGTIH